MARVSNAEKQKKYRERLKQDATKYNEMRKKNLERFKLKKLKIKEQNQTQQEKTRQKWREYSNRYYQKKNNISISNPSTTNTLSVINEHILKRWELKTIKLQKELRICRSTLNKSLKKQESMRKLIYRLKQENNSRKNLSREQAIDEDQPSPSTELQILYNSLGSVYKESTLKEKSVIKKVISNRLTKKCRMVTKIGQAIGIIGRIRSITSFSTKRKSLIQEIHNFYLRDDISRPSAGKKECKTKRKIKRQIRFLTDTILNLYTIYKREGGKASYSTLVRHRPFHVLPPKLHNRQTCACIRHANMLFKITRLYKLGLIRTNKIEELLKDIACNLDSKECMYGDCQVCAIKKIEVKKLSNQKTVHWMQWCMKTFPYKKKNEEGVEVEAFIKKYIREVKTDDVGILEVKFQEEATLFKKHYYNMMHQQKSFRECVDNIKENEAVLIVDFSENYQCKYNSEIQSMHFSSSRNQITLHTGVTYLKNEKSAGFCSISPNNEHSPLTIWAHLLPVLYSIKYQHPEIDTLHIHSDGPTTQYRQKTNFALFDMFTKQLGFKHATWSYFEAAHGKSAADGIGGVLKRTLDMHVGYGKDVPNAFEAFKLLKQETNITLYYVSDEDIEQHIKTYPVPNLWPLIGTMSVHQIITTDEPGIIKHRQVSCFCGDDRGNCSCFNVRMHRLFKKENIDIQASVGRQISITTSTCSKNKEKSSNSQHQRPMSQRNKKVRKEKANKLLVNEESHSQSSEITTKPNNKVTVLSDIRLNPDNEQYINFASPGPSSIHMIDPTLNNISLCKENKKRVFSDSDSDYEIF